MRVLLLFALPALWLTGAGDLAAQWTGRPWEVSRSSAEAGLPTPIDPRVPWQPPLLRDVDPQSDLDAAIARSSASEYMAWGALVGASAGVVSALLVYSACGEYCEGDLERGMALHVGFGALAGAATGALVHHLRRE